MTWNLINGFCLTKHEIYVGNLFRTIYSLEDTNLFASTVGTLFLALKSRTIGCGSSRPRALSGAVLQAPTRAPEAYQVQPLHWHGFD